MNTSAFLTAASLALATACSTTEPVASDEATDVPGRIGFQLIRNATIKLDLAGTTFLVDPMLAPKGAYPGFEGTLNSHLRNPLVDLPVPLAEAMQADAIVVTHTHADHWDDVARQQLPKALPVFVQNEEDAVSIRDDGFTDVRVLGDETTFNGVRLVRTAGRHGTGAHLAALGPVLGRVTGVMFEHADHGAVYVAGDTVWLPEVEAAIRVHRPGVIVLNTGYARIPGFDGSIIMGKEDLARARAAAPEAAIIGVHMEAVNHAGQTRRELRDFIVEKDLDAQRTLVPEDGQSLSF